MSLSIVLLFVSMLPLSACNGGWSDQDFDDAVEYCEEVLGSALQNPQCGHSVMILRDDLACPVDVAYEFIDLTSRLDYAGGRALLDNGCDNPLDGDPGLPGG